MLEFFKYKWASDRNFAFKTEADLDILAELPADVKTRVFKDFIYHDFLITFRKVFRFKFED